MGEIEYFLIINRNTKLCYIFPRIHKYIYMLYTYRMHSTRCMIVKWYATATPHLVHIRYLFLFLYQTGTTSMEFITMSTMTMTRVTYEVSQLQYVFVL